MRTVAQMRTAAASHLQPQAAAATACSDGPFKAAKRPQPAAAAAAAAGSGAGIGPGLVLGRRLRLACMLCHNADNHFTLVEHALCRCWSASWNTVGSSMGADCTRVDVVCCQQLLLWHTSRG